MCGPRIAEEPVLEAVAARHPVIEQWMEETREGRFIANDIYLSATEDGPEPAADYRPEHGRQEHLSAPGRDAGADGADGQLCSGGEPALRLGRSHLHAHRRQRQRGARPLHLYGGDDGDGHHPEHRNEAHR